MKTDTPPGATSQRPGVSTGCYVFTVPLHRVRHGRASAFTTAESERTPPPPRRPPRAAQTLALAHELPSLIDSSEVPDRATLARHLGLTRARVTQILDLLLLAPDIQVSVLVGAAPTIGSAGCALLRECWSGMNSGGA